MKKSLATTLVLLSLNLYGAESHFEIRYRDPKGVGYESGYGTADYLFTHRLGSPQFLLNTRIHVFNNQKFAANGGLGFRVPVNNERTLLGINAFYDFRDTHHMNADQAGCGLEVLNRYLDFRANGYLPFGKKKAVDEKAFERFQANEIIVKQRIRSTLPKVEAEFGFPFTRNFYVGVGSYYLFKQTAYNVDFGNALGGSFRARLNLGSHFWIEGDVTYDPIFKTRGQGVVSLSVFDIPVAKKTVKRDLWHTPIMRSEIIPIEKKKRTIPYLQTWGSDAVSIVFVDNSFEGLGEGTFEAPFSSLKEAEANSEPGDIIYVFPGDGTVRNMDQGIVLQEDQLLASSSAPLDIEDVHIPPMTPGIPPLITNVNPGEPVVSNPGDTQVNDFNIIEPWEYLLFQTAGGGGLDYSGFGGGHVESGGSGASAGGPSIDVGQAGAISLSGDSSPALGGADGPDLDLGDGSGSDGGFVDLGATEGGEGSGSDWGSDQDWDFGVVSGDD